MVHLIANHLPPPVLSSSVGLAVFSEALSPSTHLARSPPVILPARMLPFAQFCVAWAFSSPSKCYACSFHVCSAPTPWFWCWQRCAVRGRHHRHHPHGPLWGAQRVGAGVLHTGAAGAHRRRHRCVPQGHLGTLTGHPGPGGLVVVSIVVVAGTLIVGYNRTSTNERVS